MTDRPIDARTSREHQEQALDEALEETFPASDPPALTQPRPHPHRDPDDEILDEG